MDCPQCGLVNPPSAQRCDCGFDFETQTMEPPYFRQVASEDGGSWSWLWWIPAIAGIRALASMPREFWVAFGAITICIVAIMALLWLLRGPQIEAQEAALVAAESDDATQRANKFFERYYLTPKPEKAPDALADWIEAGFFQDPGNPVWYLFVRIARDQPALVRRYEAVFRSEPEGRPAVAKILLQVGDEQTKEFLTSHLNDPGLEPVRGERQDALENWPPPPVDPLTRPVTTAADLDMLWCEFLATGSAEPVLRVIDVFERPDRIRSKLEAWLQEEAPRGLFSSFRAMRRKHVVKTLWKQGSILCDLDRREVLSPQDLDCHCTMSGMEASRERAVRIAKLLPIDLEGEEITLFFKASARWSLASHAHQHSIIRDLCKSEAERRTGRCRILLLDITTFAALQVQDLETAFTALGASLTPDPERSCEQRQETDAEWEMLLGLSRESTSPSAEQVPLVGGAVRRCVQATPAADTFRAKRIVQTTEGTELGPGDILWEYEVARPANLRVFQTMWWESGEVYDEWISLGREYFRGPAYVSMPDPGSSLTATLMPDRYLSLLKKRQPSQFDVRVSDGRHYLLFEYKDAASSMAPWWDRFARALGVSRFRCDTVVWADFETGHLVKVTEKLKTARKCPPESVDIVHLFSSYGEPVNIVPPAFSVLEPTRPPLKTRLVTAVRRWAA